MRPKFFATEWRAWLDRNHDNLNHVSNPANCAGQDAQPVLLNGLLHIPPADCYCRPGCFQFCRSIFRGDLTRLARQQRHIVVFP